MSKTMISALDIGNGLVKSEINGEVSAYQSIVGMKYDADYIPMEDTSFHAVVENDFINNLDASFDTVLVENKARRIFGARGLKSGYTLEEFDVYSNISKAKVDLFGVLSLGTLAAKALKDYAKENSEFPKKVLKYDVILVTSLPVNEYKKYRDELAKKFMKTTHMVTVHNFETPIRIEFTFTDVKVLSEGEVAGYGIMLSDDKIIQTFLNDAKKARQNLERITPKDIKGAQNVLHIDIGEGTVNIAIFSNGKFESMASRTWNFGYGKVLEMALEKLSSMGYFFHDRKEVLEFLMSTPNALTRARYNKVESVVDREMFYFVQEMIGEVSKGLARSGGFIEMAVVHGGGSRNLYEYLYPEIVKLTTATEDGECSIPVLYLKDEYASYLNMNRLNLIAEQLSKMKTPQAKPAE